MLKSIRMQNFAITSMAEVMLDPGLTALTGETGAGKSILIDALNLVMGDRAEAGLIRHGQDRAQIHAEFSLAEDDEALAWLREEALDDGRECHVRRVIQSNGRSRAFINDTPVKLSSLRTLGEMLVAIHGQHEHQNLTRAGMQTELLDQCGGYDELLGSVAAVADDIHQCRTELNALQARYNDNQAQVELLRYQIDEMSALGIGEIDIDNILAEHDQASNADSIRELCTMGSGLLNGDDEQALSSRLQHLNSQLAPWKDHQGDLATAYEIINDADALLSEAARSLSRAEQSLDIDPENFQRLDQLISKLHEISRKHGINIKDLKDLYQSKVDTLDHIENTEINLQSLKSRLAALHEEYRQQCRALHDARSAHAIQLQQKVTEHMQELGMNGGRFEIGVTSRDDDHVSRSGLDEVVFLVSANPGIPVQPLTKVASGGELSRISLAITVSSSGTAPCMIFDEVDSGIGGRVAEIVGRQLHSLGRHSQVLCVTHLAQVAACADHHFRVVKTSTDITTESKVIPLDREARVQEIARMLGGVNITDSSLAHARELLQSLASQTG